MAHVSKFPYGGYELVIFNKDDILETIKKNIVDPEVFNDIITNLEDNIYNIIQEGGWPSYPFLGSFKPKNIFTKEIKREENKATFKEAKEKLDSEQYYAFRMRTYQTLKNTIKGNKYYNAILLQALKINKIYYNSLIRSGCSKYKANLCVYATMNIKPAICDYVMPHENR